MTNLVAVFEQASLVFKAGANVLGSFSVTPFLRNQEVIDVHILEKSLQEFLIQTQIPKKEITLIVGPEIVYSRQINKTDSVDEQFERNKFLNNIPFDPANLSIREKVDEESVTIFVANKHFFYPFVNIFVKSGMSVLAVLPSADLESVNFLDQNIQIPKEIWMKKVLILAGAVLVLLIIIGAIYYFILGRALKSEKRIESTSPIQEKIATPIAQPDPLVSELPMIPDWSQMSAIVYNGTGKGGDASKVAKILNSLGIEKVQTGNLPNQDATITQLFIKEYIASESAQKIITAVAAAFPNIETKTASSGAVYDVEIVTGL